jgi:hypothetical protein
MLSSAAMKKFLTACCSVAFAPFALAQVDSYDFFRSQFYEQTVDNTAPTDPGFVQVNARIFSQNIGDAVNATLTDPSGNTYWFNDSGVGGPPYEIDYLDNSFTTQAAEDAVYPSGLYRIDATGAHGGRGYISVPTSVFADSTPFFTGSTYDALQGMDPSRALALTWNSFTNADPSSTRQIYLQVFDTLTGNAILNSNGAADSYHGDTLAANLLQANHDYGVTVTFSTRYSRVQPNNTGGFSGLNDLVGFDEATTIFFTTGSPAPVPEPASLALVMLAPLALRRGGRQA